MAPEVGLRKPYNLSADVYSFSMLLWYVMALEPPYGFYTPEMFKDRVFEGGRRPVAKPEWPDKIQLLMKKGWSSKIAVRPEFDVIMRVLKREVAKVNELAAQEMKPYETDTKEITEMVDGTLNFEPEAEQKDRRKSYTRNEAR
jgi:serine/threonine protein kinase